MPCADGHACESQEEAHHPTEQHHDSDHEDFCSPFCTCHCCQTHVTEGNISYTKDVSSFTANTSSNTYQRYEKVILAILDPPQFVI